MGVNPSGLGKRPTIADMKRDPETYWNFYLDRFRDLSLTVRNDRDWHMNPLSKTVANELEYVNEFCEGAKVPRDERWHLCMKTNKFDTHAPNVSALFRSGRNLVALDKPVKRMIEAFHPAVIVVFGRLARDMLAQDYEVKLFADKPHLVTTADSPLVVYTRSAGYLTPNDERREYFRKLGQQYSVTL